MRINHHAFFSVVAGNNLNFSGFTPVVESSSRRVVVRHVVRPPNAFLLLEKRQDIK
jgi:hypothetical protein